MDEQDKTPETSGGAQPDTSPEELMAKVNAEGGSLEKKSAVDAMADESTTDSKASAVRKLPEQKGIKKLLSRINIYLVLFIFLVVLAGASFAVTYFLNKREQNIRLETTELTEEALEELKTSDAVVGDPRQILTIESNAIITGKVVMRDSLDIAGAIKVGGNLSVPSISIVGAGSFGSLSTNDFQAAGNGGFGGLLDVAGALTVGGNFSAAGDINGGGKLDVDGQATIGGNLNVNGTISALGINFDEISVNHINISGGQPSIGVGGAAGGGATVSISGTDTAGTATINTGGATGTGILATITFNSSFSKGPYPVLTPNGSGCASIRYYVTNISASAFSIATATNPPAGTACRFNYHVIN